MEDDNELVEDFMSEQDDSDSSSESSADTQCPAVLTKRGSAPGAADNNFIVTVVTSPNLAVGDLAEAWSMSWREKNIKTEEQGGEVEVEAGNSKSEVRECWCSCAEKYL
ncbi:hypothetical protein J6590_040458 [Homalodisca vitripennis]|nr:hypothetical protein J6590_040458 [Homalodisca vitripennis]